MKSHTLFIADKNRVPIGVGRLTYQYESWWVTSVMASRTAPLGTGKKILKILIENARKMHLSYLRLGTNFDNYSMLHCALSVGFKLEGCCKNGYVLRKVV